MKNIAYFRSILLFRNKPHYGIKDFPLFCQYVMFYNDTKKVKKCHLTIYFAQITLILNQHSKKAEKI